MRRALLLLVGCVVLGTGVAMLLISGLGSDGYSTLVNGLRLATGVPFLVANLAVGLTFIGLAWVRGLTPGLGTLAQIVVVGLTVNLLLAAFERPAALAAQVVLLVLALPVLALGIAAYLGSRTGAGPAEAFALAWDPPVPFRWNYSAMQIAWALGGWALGADVGPGTVASFLLGPAVDLAARALRVEIDQTRVDATSSLA